MLGLLAPTDARWANEALADLDAVLRDHAHCEMKAASHALSLAARHPENITLVRKLVALAQEELAHFDQVLALLASRGIALGPPRVDEYAAALHAAVAKQKGRAPSGCRLAGEPHGPSVLVDRLLVSALIEARSCERFKLLADAMGDRHELFSFYNALFVAEARHYRDLVDLARTASESVGVVTDRLAELAALEAEIVRGRAAALGRATIHG
jgi:tRNA-(ms[2]io[6]A)-hydroxylase